MNRKSLVFWISTAFALTFAYYMQSLIFLHPDIIYLLNIAARMLAGGHYVKDFFETNPPMIMYIYMPVIIVTKLFPSYICQLFRAYILLLILCSSYLSFYSLKQILRNDSLLYLLMLGLILFILCILPAHEFGQREHVMLICILPYLFVCTLRLEQPKVQINPFIACLIGFYAAIGISIKPFFLPILFLIEAYILSYQRKLWVLLRPETLAIILVTCLYVLVLFYREYDYFYKVIPLVSRLYLIGMSKSFYEIFTNTSFIFCAAALFFYFLIYKKITHKIMFTILFLALIGLMIALFIPQTFFIYQILPAMGISCLIFGLGIGELFKETLDHQFKPFQEKKKFLIGLLVSLIFVLGCPAYSCIELFTLGILAAKEPASVRFFNFVQSFYPNMTYLFLSTDGDGMFADVYPQRHGTYVGSFSAFWWENGLQILQKKLMTYPERQQLAKDENFLMEIIVRDLNVKKPLFVLADTQNRYNFIKLFLRHKNFRDAWQNYQRYQELGRFIIFKRKPDLLNARDVMPIKEKLTLR